MEARGRGAGWIAHHFLPRSKKSSRQENIKIPISKRFHAPMRSGSWWRLLPEPFLQSFSIFLLAWSPSPRGWSIPSQWDTLPVDKDPVGLGLASTDRPTPYTPLQLLLSKLDVLNIQTAGVLSAFYKLPSSEFATLNKDLHCDDLVSSGEIAIRSLRLLETLGACDETGHSHKRSQLANPPWGDHLHCFDVKLYLLSHLTSHLVVLRLLVVGSTRVREAWCGPLVLARLQYSLLDLRTVCQWLRRATHLVQKIAVHREVPFR